MNSPLQGFSDPGFQRRQVVQRQGDFLFTLQQVEQDHGALGAIGGEEDRFDIAKTACLDLHVLALFEHDLWRRGQQALANLLDQSVLYRDRIATKGHDPGDTACGANRIPVVMHLIHANEQVAWEQLFFGERARAAFFRLPGLEWPVAFKRLSQQMLFGAGFLAWLGLDQIPPGWMFGLRHTFTPLLSGQTGLIQRRGHVPRRPDHWAQWVEQRPVRSRTSTSTGSAPRS